MGLKGPHATPRETHATNPAAVQTLRPALAFHTTTPGTTLHVPQQPLPAPAPRVGPIAVGVRIVQQEGVAALFSGVSATILRQTLYSTTRMGLYDILKQKWTDPHTKNYAFIEQDCCRTYSRWHRCSRWKSRRCCYGPHAGGRASSTSPTPELQERRRRNHSHGKARRHYKPVARLIADGEPCHAGDSFSASIVRPIQGNDFGKKVDERWAWHPRDSEFRGRVRGGGGIKPGRRDKDKSDEHEGGGRGGGTVCRGVGLRSEDGEGRGPMALYKGFIPTISRQGPFTIVLFVTLEQVRKLLKNF
ncbi:hypothetical protein GH714_034280 [Hevea brasiliensis]|uniref:Uncharacterized protein n=1 Tax=Hevea brasiliensis TaxID=3981 RepID=A0A6A6KYB1_HEVBR|nr:hypothetical protein GH714_034280 [Hevea brasiliensis]